MIQYIERTPREMSMIYNRPIHKSPALTCLSLVFLTLTLVTTVAQADRYGTDVRLTGTPVPSEEISGFRGTSFELGIPDSESVDEYAVVGLTSEERKDHPCYVSVKTENLNDPSKKLDLQKVLCDGKDRSKRIEASYLDSSYDKRSFVTGVSVCMNNDNTRVKGLQVRGVTITDDGRIGPVEGTIQGQVSGGLKHIAPKEPKSERPNCNNWRRWAVCPGSNQVATAVVLHFEAGKEPRSLTGIGLQCRTLESTEPPVVGTPF